MLMKRRVKLMALVELMELSVNKSNQKIGISEERLKACLPELRKAISFYREYPDLYIDFCVECAKGNDKKVLKLYTYQRVFLRQAMRYRHIYAVYPRAYSKSFLSVLVLMLRCIFYPGCHLFVTTGGKEQATGIVREKAEELRHSGKTSDQYPYTDFDSLVWAGKRPADALGNVAFKVLGFGFTLGIFFKHSEE